MDCQTLDRLLRAWESARVEFKSRLFGQSLDKEHRVELAAVLTSLANRGGGYLLIGVDNETRAIEEGAFDDTDAVAGKIAHVNRDLCSPPTELVHSSLRCSHGEVLVIEVGKRGPMPHAVVKKPQGQIAERTYYIRNNQGKQFVTDTELHQMFLNADFPDLRRRFPFVRFYQRNGLLEPYFPDLPPWGRNVFAFTTLIQRIGPVTPKDEPEKVTRAIAEIFPYAVLSAIDRGLSAGWGRRIEPAGFGVAMKPGPEPTKFFTSNDIPRPPPNSILARAIPDFTEEAKLLVFVGLTLPANTEIDVQYAEMSVAQSSLLIRAEDVYRIMIDYRGGSWSVGLPSDHPHAYKVHPTVLKANDPHAWTFGHVDMSFEMEFGDFGPRTYSDYYSWAKRLFEIVESELSWTRYLERLPDPYLLRIGRNVDQILQRLGGDEGQQS